MTGKDGIEILKTAWHGRIDKPNYPNFDDINEALTSVEKDLEVLQELKEILLKSHKTTEHLIDNDTGKREDVDALLPVIYIEGKIKKWLEENKKI